MAPTRPLTRSLRQKAPTRPTSLCQILPKDGFVPNRSWLRLQSCSFFPMAFWLQGWLLSFFNIPIHYPPAEWLHSMPSPVPGAGNTRALRPFPRGQYCLAGEKDHGRKIELSEDPVEGKGVVLCRGEMEGVLLGQQGEDHRGAGFCIPSLFYSATAI